MVAWMHTEEGWNGRQPPGSEWNGADFVSQKSQEVPGIPHPYEKS